MCPACKRTHSINSTWAFNGDWERPTITPSIKVTWPQGKDKPPRICHSFVTDGRIQFLSDCTHAPVGADSSAANQSTDGDSLGLAIVGDPIVGAGLVGVQTSGNITSTNPAISPASDLDEPANEPQPEQEVPESYASRFAKEILAGETVADHAAERFAAFLEQHAEKLSKYIDAQLNDEHRLGPMEVAVTLEALPVGTEIARDANGWRVKSNVLGQLKFGHGESATAALASYALGDEPAPTTTTETA